MGAWATLLLVVCARVEAGSAKPVLLLCFDEGQGSTAADSSGNNHTGTLVNSPTWVPGRYGGGLRFEGGQNGHQFVRLDANDVFDGLDQGTVMAWLKVDGSPPGYRSWFVAQEAGTSCEMYPNIVNLVVADAGTGQWQYEVDTTTADQDVSPFGLYTPVPADTAAWHHVAFVVDSSGSRLYVDGIERSPTYYGGDSSTRRFFADQADSTTQYWIGSDGCPEDTWNGIIDDLRVYDYPLSRTAIRAAKASPGCPVPCPADCDGDGSTDASDLERVIAVINTCPPCEGGVGAPASGCPAIPGGEGPCAAADSDGDGCISPGELARAVASVAGFTDWCPRDAPP